MKQRVTKAVFNCLGLKGCEFDQEVKTISRKLPKLRIRDARATAILLCNLIEVEINGNVNAVERAILNTMRKPPHVNPTRSWAHAA